MRPKWTFFRVFRVLWVGVNIAILIVSASGYRDLSVLTLMLSFPASVVAGLMSLIVFDAIGWSPSVCSGGALRGESYWYDHDWLPRRLARDSFFLVVCSDEHGRVVEISTGWAH
jgi:hypothetical protein